MCARLGAAMEYMATRTPEASIQGLAMSAAYLRPCWYAVYTSANHERRVADQLASRRIEHFLPQYESVRKWKDRKVRLHLPLFPGYVFVLLPLVSRLTVLQVPGVARFVGFGGNAASIPEEDLAR